MPFPHHDQAERPYHRENALMHGFGGTEGAPPNWKHTLAWLAQGLEDEISPELTDVTLTTTTGGINTIDPEHSRKAWHILAIALAKRIKKLRKPRRRIRKPRHFKFTVDVFVDIPRRLREQYVHSRIANMLEG